MSTTLRNTAGSGSAVVAATGGSTVRNFSANKAMHSPSQRARSPPQRAVVRRQMLAAQNASKTKSKHNHGRSLRTLVQLSEVSRHRSGGSPSDETVGNSLWVGAASKPIKGILRERHRASATISTSAKTAATSPSGGGNNTVAGYKKRVRFLIPPDGSDNGALSLFMSSAF